MHTLIMVGAWIHKTAGRYPVFSWLSHAAFGVPAALIIGPWAPLFIFGYREGEQVFFKYLRNERRDWPDHVMDVLVPAAVGLIVAWR